MKTFKKLVVVLTLLSPNLCLGDALVQKNCEVNNIYAGGAEGSVTEVGGPIRWIRITYNGTVEISPDAVGYIMCGNEKVAQTVSSEVDNYDTEGYVLFYFSDECLPKGKEYTFCLPEGSVNLVEDKEVTNDEMQYPFIIPADLGTGDFQMENGCEIESTSSSIGCCWSLASGLVGYPEWELYREGNLVRKYPVKMSWDWNLGYAYFNPKEKIHFEKGVRYSLVLPEGSVRASREDIVNKRTSLEFTGGYAEQIPSPSYNECRLSEDNFGQLTKVNFYIDTPVSLIPGKPILLYEENDRENTLQGILPTVSYYDGEKSVVTAVFAESTYIYIDPEKVYTVEMPEGTVVTSKGDIAVNKTQTTNIGGTTGLSENKIGESKIKVDGKSISVSGINSGVSLTLYDINGRVVKTITGSSEYVSMEVEDTGIYILVVGGKSFKVVVR